MKVCKAINDATFTSCRGQRRKRKQRAQADDSEADEEVIELEDEAEGSGLQRLVRPFPPCTTRA